MGCFGFVFGLLSVVGWDVNAVYFALLLFALAFSCWFEAIWLCIATCYYFTDLGVISDCIVPVVCSVHCGLDAIARWC